MGALTLPTSGRVYVDTALIIYYEKFLTETRLQLHPINAAILKGAARLRAATRLKTPDAIHAATALAAGCSQLLANDDSFRRIESLQVIMLKDLL